MSSKFNVLSFAILIAIIAAACGTAPVSAPASAEQNTKLEIPTVVNDGSGNAPTVDNSNAEKSVTPTSTTPTCNPVNGPRAIMAGTTQHIDAGIAQASYMVNPRGLLDFSLESQAIATWVTRDLTFHVKNMTPVTQVVDTELMFLALYSFDQKPGPFASYVTGTPVPLKQENFQLVVINRYDCGGKVDPLFSLKLAAEQANVKFPKRNQTVWINVTAKSEFTFPK